MTIIAWDSKKLATDSMVSTGINEHMRAPKIHLLEQKSTKVNPKGANAIVAGTGDFQDIMRFMLWWEKGGVYQEDYPFPVVNERGDRSTLIVVGDDQIFEYNNDSAFSLYSYNINGKYAWGSGNQVALAALMAGKDAIDAVKIAIDICPGCGGGIQYCELGKREIVFLEPKKIEYEKVDSMKFDLNIV